MNTSYQGEDTEEVVKVGNTINPLAKNAESPDCHKQIPNGSKQNSEIVRAKKHYCREDTEDVVKKKYTTPVLEIPTEPSECCATPYQQLKEKCDK